MRLTTFLEHSLEHVGAVQNSLLLLIYCELLLT